MNKNNIPLHKLLLLGRLTLYNTAQFGSDLQSKCYCPCMHQRHMFFVCVSFVGNFTGRGQNSFSKGILLNYSEPFSVQHTKMPFRDHMEAFM